MKREKKNEDSFLTLLFLTTHQRSRITGPLSSNSFHEEESPKQDFFPSKKGGQEKG